MSIGKGQTSKIMDKFKDSKAHIYWQFLILLLVAWTAIEAPLMVALHEHEIRTWQLAVDALMTIVFAIDIYINFKHQARDDKEFHEFHVQGYHDYKRSYWLPFDILACIPFDIIASALGIGNPSLFRLFRLVKLVRVAKIFSILTTLDYLPRGFKISSILISAIVAIHWIACGWLMFGNPMASEADFLTEYNLALYWAITTLTTIGYGDITPSTNIGRMFTMSIMLLGVGVYGLVIGNISKIIVSASRHKEKMREKIQDLSLLMKHYEVPRKVQSEVFMYFHNLSKQRLTDNDQKIINELPHNLKNELSIYMILRLVSDIPLFEGLKQHELKSVARVLKQEFYSPGDNIINRGDKGESMFIIANGAVNIHNKNDEVINTLQSGQFFGEIALMMDIERGADVVAKSYCDVYTLSKDNFNILLERYPALADNIDKVIVKRKSDRSKKAA